MDVQSLQDRKANVSFPDEAQGWIALHCAGMSPKQGQTTCHDPACGGDPGRGSGDGRARRFLADFSDLVPEAGPPVTEEASCCQSRKFG